MKYYKIMEIFSGAGISTLNLNTNKLRTVCMLEKDKKRCSLYQRLHETDKYKVNCICGDIRDDEIKKKLIREIIRQNISIILISPVCTAVSLLGKNKNINQYKDDYRNYLIFHAMEVIDSALEIVDYILIENVARFKDIIFDYNGRKRNIEAIIREKYGNIYDITAEVMNFKDYGVGQNRARFIIRMCRKGKVWQLPKKKREIKLKDTIGFLPSLEPGEESYVYPLHKAPVLHDGISDALRHTPSGQSAMGNVVWYPKTKSGERVKGFITTYKRNSWDKCAYTVTSGVRGSNCFHPGRKLSDGTYSDPRNFTLLELLIISSVIKPKDIENPDKISDNTRKIIDAFAAYPETFVRHCLADGIPSEFMCAMFRYIK